MYNRIKHREGGEAWGDFATQGKRGRTQKQEKTDSGVFFQVMIFTLSPCVISRKRLNAPPGSLVTRI